MKHLDGQKGRLGALALTSALTLLACGDDDDKRPLASADGGLDGGGGMVGVGAAGGGGGAAGSGASTGAGGAGAGGAGGSGAAAGAGPDAGDRDGGRDGGGADGGEADARAAVCVEPDAGDGAVTGARLLVVETDFFSSSEIITVDVNGRRVIGRAALDDGDVTVRVSDGRAFALERTTGHVSELAPDGSVETRITLAGDGGTTANPHSIAVVPGTDKAYVTLYDDNAVAVVDLASGTVTGRIDLGAFLSDDDADGSVDADAAVYDPVTGYVYVTLQRVDRTTITMATGYRQLCRSAPSLLVAIDPATDALAAVPAPDGGADAGADAGDGGAQPWVVELSLVGPQDTVLESDRLLMVSNGCFDVADGGYTRRDHGVEAVALPTGVTTTLLAPPDEDLYNGLLYFGSASTLVVHFDSSFATHYTSWDPSSPTLGADVVGVPEAPSVAGAGELLGIAGGAVVRFDTTTSQSETLVTPACLGDLRFVGSTTLWP